MTYSAIGFTSVTLTTPFNYTTAAGNLQMMVVRTDNLAAAGPVMNSANGNSTGAALTTCRRFNGATPVLGEPESHDVDFLRSVLELLEHPASPAALPGGMNLAVDEPNGVSSVTMAFKSSLGTASLSILGPTRMRYPQAISVAKAVSDALV